MSDISITVKTLKQTSHPLTISSVATVAQLKEVASEKLDLGTMTNVVLKGAPLKDDTKTLEEVGIVDGTTVIGVFRKAAAAPAAPATPAADATATATAAPADATPAATDATAAPAATPAATPAPTAAAVAAPPAFLQEEWACEVCTFINIPARTVCEACDTPSTSRRLPGAPTSRPAAAAGLQLSDMNDDDGEDDNYDLEETLRLIESNEDVRKQYRDAYRLPETATMEDFRTALTAQPPSVVSADDPAALLALLAHNPELQQRLSEVLMQGSPNSAAVYEALQNLVAESGGIMVEEDEDGMGDEDEDMVNENLEFDQDPW